MKRKRLFRQSISFLGFILLFFNAAAGDKLFFDGSAQRETSLPETFSCIDSPSQNFAVELGFPEQDSSDLIFVALVDRKNHRKRTIGIAVRAIDVKWHRTRLGELLVLTHQFDTHQNEVYVFYPRIISEKEIRVDLLYSAGPTEYIPPGVKWPLDHRYWTVKKIEPDGILVLHGEWDFTDPGIPGVSRDFTIPLFYGYGDKSYRKNNQVTKQ